MYAFVVVGFNKITILMQSLFL